MRDLTQEKTDSFLVTIQAAEFFARYNYPWKIHLVFQDGQKNADKFWSVTGTGNNSPVTITWGRNGCPGQTSTESATSMFKRARVKLSKGYRHHPLTLSVEECRIWMSMVRL